MTDTSPEYPGPFRVLVNGRGQHAVWPQGLPVPGGWREVFGPAPLEDCRAAIRARWTDLRPTGPNRRGPTVHELFRRQAARQPDAPAVVGDDGELDYRSLDRESDRLASALRRQGLGAEDVVAVCLPRTCSMVVALLGVLKAGAAFLPLDPAHPEERLRRLIRAGKAELVLDADGFDDAMAAGRDGPALDRGVTDAADDLAYLVHTSGTLGRPRGVEVGHRSLAFVLSRVAAAYRLGLGDRVVQLGGLGFDTSLEQVFAPLLAGAAVLLGGAETWAPTELVDRIPRLGATVVDLTPAYWQQFLEAHPGGALGSLRLVIVGGDLVPAEACRTALRLMPDTGLVNAYGLTETTITSTLCTITGDVLARSTHAPAPVGRPLPGTSVHVLQTVDDGLRPVPPGEKGEIYLGGGGVARGYLGHPAFTAERFLPDPWTVAPGERMYRTGDTGRLRPDGSLEVLGRIDDQVKIRGYRVAPAEIEAVLLSHPDVRRARVGGGRLPHGGTGLTAFYIPSNGTSADPAALREHVAARLPAYMVPAAFEAVTDLALTPSGKIARRPTASGGAAPNALESAVAALWGQILGVEGIGPHDDFFELGGNSLLVLEMIARARLMFGIAVGEVRGLTRSLLSEPRLDAFARAVQAARTGAAVVDAAQTLDHRAEARLDVPVRHDPERPPHWDSPREVLVTGVTGFCGAHLLRALLDHTPARVHCLVRALDDGHAQERIRAAQQRYLHRDLGGDRVIPHAGDLAAPRLGLPDRAFDELTDRLDLIYHFGGQVNFIYPYHELRAANVGGTREIVRLAGHSRAIPVHYLSSMAVVAGRGAAGIDRAAEDDPLSHPEYLTVGYVESKWVAERLLHNAAEAGLPVTVYRADDITGDVATGTTNTATELCALIKYLTESGSSPAVSLPLDFTPADVLSRAVVHISTHVPPRASVYHLTNPGAAELGLLEERLRARGYQVRSSAYREWVDRLVRFAAAHPGHPMTPFVPLFVDRCAARADLTISEMYFHPTYPRADRTHAADALRGSGIDLPPVDAHMLDRYLDHLLAVGFLDPPRDDSGAAP